MDDDIKPEPERRYLSLEGTYKLTRLLADAAELIDGKVAVLVLKENHNQAVGFILVPKDVDVNWLADNCVMGDIIDANIISPSAPPRFDS